MARLLYFLPEAFRDEIAPHFGIDGGRGPTIERLGNHCRAGATGRIDLRAFPISASRQGSAGSRPIASQLGGTTALCGSESRPTARIHVPGWRELRRAKRLPLA